MSEPHDHARPDVAAQHAVLAVARAVADGDPERAAVAAQSAPCPVCAVVAAVQLGNAMCAVVAGEGSFPVSDRLRRRVTAMLDVAQREIDASAN